MMVESIPWLQDVKKNLQDVIKLIHWYVRMLANPPSTNSTLEIPPQLYKEEYAILQLKSPTKYNWFHTEMGRYVSRDKSNTTFFIQIYYAEGLSGQKKKKTVSS